MSDPYHTLSRRAGGTLQRMLRELLARKPGGHLVHGAIDELSLSLPLAQRPGAEADARFAAELAVALEQAVDRAIRRAATFRPGHAFCHRCGGAVCGHAPPPSCRHVQVGYAATGIPRWIDFAQYCLEQRHAEVDRLFDNPPAFVTLAQTGQELRRDVLQAFRSPDYEVEGQLLAGFFPVRTRADEGRGVLALTFQSVAMPAGAGRTRRALNVLGVAPDGGELGTLWDRFDEIPWRRAVRWAQDALTTLDAGHRRGSNRSGDPQRLTGILRGLARRLERDRRGRMRRTRHAEMRHRSGARPTRKAVEDISAAGTDAFMYDEKSGTMVVLGDRGRAHFFTPAGRLVSSVHYSREAIERKRKLGVWRDASADEAARLRAALGGTG